MQRIMRECKEMQKKKQMFIYAQPLEVSTVLLSLRTNHSNGISQSEAHQRLTMKEAYTMEVLHCLMSTR